MKIFLVAGDPSGDMHGADLMRALKEFEPGLKLAAIGGSSMRRYSDEFLENLASLGVAGFLEPVRRLPLFWKLHSRIKDYLRREKPDAVICIDFYGFNRWVLEAAQKAGIPAFYYVSPQVWASRPSRIQTLRRLVRRMFVIFPFEEKLYREAEVPVTFMGHPLLDRLPEPASKGKDLEPLRIGLLPGSRASEVSRHLPLFLETLQLLRQNYASLKAYVFASPSLPDSFYADAARFDVSIVRETDYAIRADLDLALSSSGTATLENALLGIPMVVVYRMSWPTYWIARSLIRVPYISMVNLLAKRPLVPELIQEAATPKQVAQSALDLLKNPQEFGRLRRELIALRDLLGSPGAATRTAKAILAEISPNDSVRSREPLTSGRAGIQQRSAKS